MKYHKNRSKQKELNLRQNEFYYPTGVILNYTGKSIYLDEVIGKSIDNKIEIYSKNVLLHKDLKYGFKINRKTGGFLRIKISEKKDQIKYDFLLNINNKVKVEKYHIFINGKKFPLNEYHSPRLLSVIFRMIDDWGIKIRQRYHID